ncbi:MAG: hypothetical protein RR184_09280 [Citrobacter sp.]|uniref:hypothetical protein n=1 Tax=Citrobacter sp. TaxID=1896336 RepID=UPI002FC83D40
MSSGKNNMPNTFQLKVPANACCYDSRIEIVSGHKYRFTVTGSWVDFHDDPVNANGNNHPGGIRNFMGWAKRAPEVPWMALLIRSKSKFSTSDWRWVGNGESFVADLPAGMLELCANDVVGFYRNNSGTLIVTVTDITKEN